MLHPKLSPKPRLPNLRLSRSKSTMTQTGTGMSITMAMGTEPEMGISAARRLAASRRRGKIAVENAQEGSSLLFRGKQLHVLLIKTRQSPAQTGFHVLY